MKTILIIGITGFLGRNLAKLLWEKYRNTYEIIGTGLSPNKIALFKSMRRSWLATEADIPCICIDIVHDRDKLEYIFRNRKINYVIHAAALKYVDIAEKDPSKCVDTNIIGTMNVIHLANKYNVDNLIALSTDKANRPINTYGMSKYLMQQITLQSQYSVYQGVNFFWSDGSVVDLWYRQIKKNTDLCITDPNQERFYSEIGTTSSDIIDNIDIKRSVILPTQMFKIKLSDLHNSMIKYFNYDSMKKYSIGCRDNEKQIELLNEHQSNTHIIATYNEEQIMELLERTMNNVEISCI